MTKIIPKELEQTLLPWINMTNKLFADAIIASFREHDIDLSREQMIILKHLSQEDGRVQNDLAYVTNRDKTSLTRLVNKMEKKSLIRRVQCKNDQRCNKIYITDKGKSSFTEAFPVVAELVHKMQANIKKEEIESTINTLKLVFHNLSELHDEKK